MMWNPAIGTLFASATVTGEVTMWEVRGDSLVQASTKQTFGASSLCWSSKVCKESNAMSYCHSFVSIIMIGDISRPSGMDKARYNNLF